MAAPGRRRPLLPLLTTRFFWTPPPRKMPRQRRPLPKKLPLPCRRRNLTLSLWKHASPTVNDSYEYAAQETGTVEYSPYRIRIDVDAEYIGNALDGYTPVIEADSPNAIGTELYYELTMAQYEYLLHALAGRSELPAEKEFETDSQLVLVVVH